MLNTRFLIRRMTINDIDKVMTIEQESFTLPWSKQSYLKELENSYAVYLVCDIGGEIAGYGGFWAVFEEAHITNVAVNQKFRGSGIGEVLMQELEKIARGKNATQIMLEVRPSNEAALNLYKKLAYVVSNVRKQYYSDNGEDALLMNKLLF